MCWTHVKYPAGKKLCFPFVTDGPHDRGIVQSASQQDDAGFDKVSTRFRLVVEQICKREEQTERAASCTPFSLYVVQASLRSVDWSAAKFRSSPEGGN